MYATGPALFVVPVLLILLIAPCLSVALSKKVLGTQKLIWFLLSLFFSWLGFITYYFYVVKPQWEEHWFASRKERYKN